MVSHWQEWWTKCKRYRVVRSVHKYDLSLSRFVSGEGLLVILREHTSLGAAMAEVERHHAAKHDIQMVMSNLDASVSLAREKGLDRLPDQFQAPRCLPGAPTQSVGVKAVPGTLFGYDALALIRWMGQDGCIYEQAKCLCHRLEMRLLKSMVRHALVEGREGKDVPTLTDAQADALYEMIR